MAPERVQRLLCEFAAGAAVLWVTAWPWIAVGQGAQSVSAGNTAEATRVWVPGGLFTMGSDTEGEPDERPAHRVDVRGFWIDRTEVSREAYARCVRAGACASVGRPERFRNPRMPVVLVSWSMAGRYCRWANGRLPTEPEFEKAARGTDSRRFPWGNDWPTPARAVFARYGRDAAPDPVGTHPLGASPYGALDMTGNVWEWTDTVYDPYAYRRPSQTPTCESALAAFAELRRQGRWAFTGAYGIPDRCHRVLRGGAWNYNPLGLRCSNRVHHEPEFRGTVSGFRCAYELAPPGASAR